MIIWRVKWRVIWRVMLRVILTGSLKSYLTSTSCAKNYLTSYVTSYLTGYLTSYVVSDVTRLLYEVLKVTLRSTENRSWKCCPRPAASHSTFKTSATVGLVYGPTLSRQITYLVFRSLSQIIIFIPLLPPAHTRRGLQMQYTNWRCKEEFLHFNIAIKICLKIKLLFFHFRVQ